MENYATISWKDQKAGKVSNIMSDMWYLEADWLPTGSKHCSKFENIACKLNPKEVIESPFKGLVADLNFDGSSSSPQKVLVLSLDNSKIFMRMISDETAAFADLSLLAPWQAIGNAIYYENELKKEVTFFHPLKWKKVRAVGKRTDRDEVLFEVLNSKYKYALVHLTYSKERSHKFPITEFFVDWKDVYKNRLFEDHKELEKDLGRDDKGMD